MESSKEVENVEMEEVPMRKETSLADMVPEGAFKKKGKRKEPDSFKRLISLK